LAILLTPPIALIVSIIAWIRNANRRAAIAGTVISGVIILLFFLGQLLSSLCR
jgi:hypothetical protein